MQRAGRLIASTCWTAISCTGSSLGSLYVIHPDGSGDFPTIQQALTAADSGDVIELADGVFLGDENHNLDFLGKPLTLRSQSDNPARCIIDCVSTGADPGVPERGFEFHNGEDSTCVVRGITIANGSAAGT